MSDQKSSAQTTALRSRLLEIAEGHPDLAEWAQATLREAAQALAPAVAPATEHGALHRGLLVATAEAIRSMPDVDSAVDVLIDSIVKPLWPAVAPATTDEKMAPKVLSKAEGKDLYAAGIQVGLELGLKLVAPAGAPPPTAARDELRFAATALVRGWRQRVSAPVFLELVDKLEEALAPGGAAVPASPPERTCHWAKDDNILGPYWDTQCGEAYTSRTGELAKNHLSFCPFCGGKIVNKLDASPRVTTPPDEPLE
jgi:hypothetical protein